jgi:hypothetical protein
LISGARGARVPTTRPSSQYSQVSDTPGDAADDPAALRIASALDAIGKTEYPN